MVISQRMVEAGFACVLTAQLKGRTVLLICSIHPAATEEEIRYTIQLLGQICRTLKEKCFPQSSVITDYETLFSGVYQE